MNKNNWIETVVTIIIGIIFLYAVVSCSWMIVDRHSNSETTVIEVYDKRQEMITTCDEDGCSSTTYYYAETDRGELPISSRQVYSLLTAGKKHHVEIRGKRFPTIANVLE